jgi:anthraniloyl-CoA monooxygenase
MNVSIVGAGPGGLYLGILLAKADPAHEIRIMERNPPDATFGWGVVFSDETLGQLRDADPQTYVEITDTFVRWDAVDIRYRGRLLRSRGHAFSAIARTQLLAILQHRCEELGVKLEFGVEIDDPATVSGDVVVAADGVNSVFRRRCADVLGTVVEPQGCKYVWFSCSTRSGSSFAKPNTACSRCMRIRSTSTPARSSSSARSRPGSGRGSTG